AAKHFAPSFEVLVVPLDSRLLGLSREVLDLREYWGQRGWVRRGFVGGHRVRRSPRVLESGAKESSRCFGITVFPEEHFDDLPVLIEGAVDRTPAPRHFDLRFVDRPALPQAAPRRLGGVPLERSKLLHP